MLTGRRLYTGETVAVLERIVEEPPPDVGDVRRDVPPELAELLFELLAKEPDERPATAADVSRRLGSTLANVQAEEGPLELASFLLEHHAQERAEWRESLGDALEDADATVHEIATPEVLEVHDAATRLLTERAVLDTRGPLQAAERSRVTLMIAIAAGLLSLGIGGTVVALVLGRPEPEPTTVIGPVPHEEPTVVVTQAAPAVEPVSSAEQDDVPTDAPQTAPSQTDPEPPTPRRRRRVRRVRSTGSDAPTWGWE